MTYSLFFTRIAGQRSVIISLHEIVFSIGKNFSRFRCGCDYSVCETPLWVCCDGHCNSRPALYAAGAAAVLAAASAAGAATAVCIPGIS